jgi:predicted metal-dependent enzyme (double-stranded beta helix superfamily)
VNKILYKPLSFVVSALGGVLAGKAFTEIWKRVAGEEDAPSAIDRSHTWTEVLVAATVQGAIFGLVKAATERAGAIGYRKATGDWPED